MSPKALKPEELIIPPYSRLAAHCSPAAAHQQYRSTADPGRRSDSLKTFSSAPDLHRVVVALGEGLPRPKLSPYTQFRVGRVGLRRSQTGPKHVTEKINPGLSHVEHYPGRSTPNLQNSPIPHQTQPHAILRRRKTWPSLLTKPKDKRHYSTNQFNSQSNRYRVAPQASSSAPVGFIPPKASDLPIRGPNTDLEPLESLKRPEVFFDEATPFWDGYNKMADFEDREFVKALGVNLDTLLIFAGLFSAINTAFIIEALKTLQPDQAEKTNDLVRSVILILHNSTFTDTSLHDAPFVATQQAFRSTAVLFVSLIFSLTAAFGAVMAKQWLNYYEREGGLKPPAARGRERQKKYEARDQWHMGGIIETLPTLLQISLILFAIALIDFLWSIQLRLGYLLMEISLLPALFYLATTIIAVVYPAVPLQTRLSISIKNLCNWVNVYLVNVSHLVKNAWRASAESAIKPLHPLDATPPTPRPWLQRRPYGHHARAIEFYPTVESQPDISLSDLDYAVSLRCLITYMQRATFPQDLTAFLTGMNSLPAHVSADAAHRSAMGVLVELSISRVLKPWYQYTTSKHLPNTEVDFRQLLKMLKLAFTCCGYGFNQAGDHKYVLSSSADRWMIQEVFDALFRGPLDVDLASMTADVLSSSMPSITCSVAQLETLCQNLERPSNDPKHYLPYINLLSHALHYKTDLGQPQSERVLHALVSTMWIDGQIDLDYYRGWLRLKVLPARLVDDADVHCFSEFLLQWREEGANQDNLPRGWRDDKYAQSIGKLLNSHQSSDFWPQTLEEGGHVSALLDILSNSSNDAAQCNALYGFLILWNRIRLVTASDDSSLYFNPSAVDAVFRPWRWVEYLVRQTPVYELMEHTVSYLEEAKRLQLLEGRDLTEFIAQYRIIGTTSMGADDRLHLWYKRVKNLTIPLTLPSVLAERQLPEEV